MITTAVPVSHNGITVYTGGGSSPSPSCTLGIFGKGCAIDFNSIGSGTGAIVKNSTDTILNVSQTGKDFTASLDKVSLLIPFIILMLAFGLAIGWSKGHRYFA